MPYVITQVNFDSEPNHNIDQGKSSPKLDQNLNRYCLTNYYYFKKKLNNVHQF